MLSLNPEVLVCWVSPSQESAARARWGSFTSLPAVAAGRVFIVTDPDWTIPSARTAELAGKLADMIHPQPASQVRP